MEKRQWLPEHRAQIRSMGTRSDSYRNHETEVLKFLMQIFSHLYTFTWKSVSSCYYLQRRCCHIEWDHLYLNPHTQNECVTFQPSQPTPRNLMPTFLAEIQNNNYWYYYWELTLALHWRSLQLPVTHTLHWQTYPNLTALGLPSPNP